MTRVCFNVEGEDLDLIRKAALLERRSVQNWISIALPKLAKNTVLAHEKAEPPQQQRDLIPSSEPEEVPEFLRDKAEPADPGFQDRVNAILKQHR